MIKSVILGITTMITAATANLYIYMPDSSSTWYTGSTGNVLWNSTAADFGLQCTIQLINVDTEDVVYNVTAEPIPCSINNYTSDPLPVLEGEKFLIRIGENNYNNSWVYTQDFSILNHNATYAANDNAYQDY